MAAKKRLEHSAPTAEQRAAWDASYGRTRLVTGFGTTPDDDLLFAVGYPNVVVAVEAPPPRVEPAKLWKMYPEGTTHLPAPFLTRYLAALEASDVAALSAEPKPFDDACVADFAAKRWEFGGSYELLVLEAIVGSERLARAMVDTLGAFPLEAWSGVGDLDTYGGDVMRTLYFVLLRVTPATRDALRARLAELDARASAAALEGSRVHEALDVVLHGAAGVERHGYRSARPSDENLFADLVHADDDPTYVERRALAALAGMKPADRARFDLRIAFLGGAKVLAAMRDPKKFHSTWHDAMEQQLARVR